MERTYIMLKPDAYKNKIIGKVIERIEEKGYKITNIKMMTLGEPILREHYSHLADKPFFPEILEFMTSGPVVGMIVEGKGIIDSMRVLMGPTNPNEALPGTIRRDFGTDKMRNVIHGSDSLENAEAEIKRFFGA